jgi:hypothetical protein
MPPTDPEVLAAVALYGFISLLSGAMPATLRGYLGGVSMAPKG